MGGWCGGTGWLQTMQIRICLLYGWSLCLIINTQGVLKGNLLFLQDLFNIVVRRELVDSSNQNSS
jgi:hypothetical protein